MCLIPMIFTPFFICLPVLGPSEVHWTTDHEAVLNFQKIKPPLKKAIERGILAGNANICILSSNLINLS